MQGQAPTYAIREWSKNFEPSQAKRNSGPLQWVAVPTKHDGRGYRRVMRLPNGPAIYCAWVLMLQVAAKCPRRGVLADDDGPLDADDLATKTDAPSELFEEAFAALTDPKIGWLVVNPHGVLSESAQSAVGDDAKDGITTVGAPSETSPSALPPPDRTGPDRTGHNNTGSDSAPVKDCKQPPSAAKRSRGKRFTTADVVLADLTDDVRLQKLFGWIANCGNFGVQRTEAGQLLVFALAERALEIGSKPQPNGDPGNPVAFFLNDLKNRWFDRINGEQEDRARRRLNHLRDSRNGPHSDLVAEAVSHCVLSFTDDELEAAA